MTLPGVIAPDSSVPIACSLTAGAVGDRESEWCELLSRALISRAPAPGGVRIELRPLPGVRRELQRLIAAERDCCPFMAMSVDTTAAKLVLLVTAPALAAPIVEQLFVGHRG
jgi:MerR family transcriptional regulator, copper efflux regulator